MVSPLFTHAWDNQTTLHPVGLAAVLICGVATLLVPRRYALWPIIFMACFVAPAQRIAVFSLDFTLLRIMVIFGWVRLLSRSECRFQWKLLDYLVVGWCMANIIMPTISLNSTKILVTKLGYGFDCFGMYFLFRSLIRDIEDLKNVMSGFAWISLPVAAAFFVEKSTGRNLFAFLGGVPELTLVRSGRLRCQGAFAHPILAGCFWAVLLPTVVALFWAGWSKWKVVIAASAMLVIIICSSSSTPIMAVIFGGIGFLFYFARHYMWLVQLILVFLLISLHLCMKAPVWHLIARIDVVSGSTGWHRANLIDQAFRHAHEWWLTGSRVGSAHWGFGCEDVTNAYIVQGLCGGLLQLALFIAIIAVGFWGIGRAWRAAGKDRKSALLAWSLGIGLFVHVMNFFAVSYFGQIDMIWYLTLATTTVAVAPKAVKVRRVAVRREVRHAGSLATANWSHSNPV